MVKINAVSLLFFLQHLLLPVTVYSQEPQVKYIQEVTVSQGNKEFFSDDQTTQTVDRDWIRLHKHQNLGYLLTNQTPVLVKTYGGTGSLSSVSLHGTGSNHTQINWNGFPVNSPTTGQADLSLIPVGFLESVEVISGTSGALFGSGTFGGSVNLINEPDWSNRISLNYSLNTGSFGSFGNLLSLRTGNSTVQYQLSVITAKSDNDFTYRDIYKYQSPDVKNHHNAFRSLGIMQNLFLNLHNGNHLDAGVWYQSKTIEVPVLMGSYKESHARQRDSVFRSFISYSRITQKSALNIKSAYFSDYLRFVDKNQNSDTVNTIDSRIATRRWIHEFSYRHYFSTRLILSGGATYGTISGNSGNYGGEVFEHEYALFGTLKASFTRMIFNAALRKEFYDGLNPPIQYSFGLRFNPNEHFILRSGFSSKFRKPTFNEKYWHPGVIRCSGLKREGEERLRPNGHRRVTRRSRFGLMQELQVIINGSITGFSGPSGIH